MGSSTEMKILLFQEEMRVVLRNSESNCLVKQPTINAFKNVTASWVNITFVIQNLATGILCYRNGSPINPIRGDGIMNAPPGKINKYQRVGTDGASPMNGLVKDVRFCNIA